jgi:hypothetical protein
MKIGAYEIEKILDRYARDHGVRPEQPYYIWGEFRIAQNGQILYSDEAHEYCRSCAEALLDRVLPLLPSERRDDHRVATADCSAEDTCKHCMVCGALLDYGLNDWGVEHELEHYAAELPKRSDLSAGEAFHIARLLEAAPFNREVIAVARLALSRITTRSRAASAAQ